MQLLKLLEAAHGPFAQLVLAPDDEEVPVRACVERERQAPVALATDVPVAHVVEPVLHPIARVGRQPAHFRRGLLELRPELVHRDEPLVADAEDDLLLAPPADRVAVRVRELAEEAAALAQVIRDLVRDVARVSALEPAEAGHEVRVLVDGHEDRRVLALAKSEVFGPAAGCDVNDPRSLGLADLIPCDDLVRRSRNRAGRELVERTRVAQADEVAALDGPDDLGVVPLRLCVDLGAEDQ